MSTFENVATIFHRICQNLSQACSQSIDVLRIQTSAKEDLIFGMKNQISIASVPMSLVFLISKPVTLVEKLTMNVGTDLELQIPVG